MFDIIKKVTNKFIKSSANICAESTSGICFYDFKIPYRLSGEAKENNRENIKSK